MFQWLLKIDFLGNPDDMASVRVGKEVYYRS